MDDRDVKGKVCMPMDGNFLYHGLGFFLGMGQQQVRQMMVKAAKIIWERSAHEMKIASSASSCKKQERTKFAEGGYKLR